MKDNFVRTISPNKLWQKHNEKTKNERESASVKTSFNEKEFHDIEPVSREKNYLVTALDLRKQYERGTGACPRRRSLQKG